MKLKRSSDVPMSEPKVSVCIPAYNYGKYLKRCLESVLAQTYEDFEIVLVDNASTDETSDIARTFDDPRVRYICNTSTVSAVENHNKAFSLAVGEYIALLAADDEFLPNRLLRCAEALDENPDVGLVYSALIVVDTQGNTIETVRPYAQNRVIPGKQEFASLIQENHIACPTTMFRAELCRQLGSFRQVRYTPDWDLWLRFAVRSDVAYIAEPLARYRVHSESETAAYNRTGQVDLDLAWTVRSAFLELPDEFRDLMYLRKQVLPRYCLPAAWRAFELGDLITSHQYLQDAFEADPQLSIDTGRIADSIVHFSVKRLLPVTTPLQFAESLCNWLGSVWPGYVAVRRPVLSGVHAALAFQAHEACRSDKVCHHAIRAVASNPTWLQNRGLLSITLESLVGRRVMGYVRRVV